MHDARYTLDDNGWDLDDISFDDGDNSFFVHTSPDEAAEIAVLLDAETSSEWEARKHRVYRIGR